MKKKFGAIAAMLAVAVLLSIFTVSVFATDESTPDSTTTVVETGETTPSSDTTTAEPSGTTASSTTSGNAEGNKLPISQIIPLAILAVGVVALAVVFFGLPKYREKTLKFCRSIKRECKNVSWYSWKNTRKGTVVVVVCVAALAIVIGLLDVLFSTVINTLTKIF